MSWRPFVCNIPVKWIGLTVVVLGTIFGATRADAQNAVCAEVKLEIKQKLSLERQAFDATMRVNNGLDVAAITNVGIDLVFTGQDGLAVVASSDPNNTSASFFVRIDSLSGITAIDGTGSVAAKTTAEIHWLIIPAAGAGGILPQGKLYFVGASLKYSLLGATQTVSVVPDTITVRPQPLLAVDYFLPGDVYADDAFTPATEPPVPFTLGVRLKNVGGGTAAKTTIESAQPKIVENQQGLLIGFQILGGFVGDQAASNTLLLNFGDIGPGASAMGRWTMQTTLSGKFTDFQAGFTHADSLGGALTSLIQGINTHLLVHDVKADLPGRDSIRDFLALDGNVLRLYESEGIDSVVTDQSGNARLRPTTANQYDLNFQATTGFAYAKLTDPTGGQATPGAVVRSDGKTLLTENVWLSKTRNADLSWSYFINFFDANTTGIYTVNLVTSGLGAKLSGFVYADTNNNGQKDSGEPGIGVTSVTLTGVSDLGAAVNTTAYADADGSFSFVQLAAGTYSLKVGAVAGYLNGTLSVGSTGGTASVDTISGIILSAAANGSGYLFAKRAYAPGSLIATVAASSSVNPSAQGQTVVFTAALSGPGPTPTGAVTFLDGATPLCLTVAIVAGRASCAYSDLPSGSRSITASYLGDSSYASVTSPPYVQTVGGVSTNILTVGKRGNGSGTVTSNPPGINCGSRCAEPYLNATLVTLTAIPNTGSVFRGWLGACVGTGSCSVNVSGATNVTATFAPSSSVPRLDIDGSNTYNALTDGMLILRYLSGQTGIALTNGALGGASGQPTLEQILLQLDNMLPLLDIDGNGKVDAQTDGLLLVRYLFGIRGPALIAGAVGSGATRWTAHDIELYVQSLMP